MAGQSSTAKVQTSNNEECSADELALRAQGHVGELPRQFSAFAALALAFSITNSWIGYSASFIGPLYAGGGPAVIYCVLVATVPCWIINAGLAELASAFPTSGGQYHFAFIVSSERYRALAAFVLGWLSVIAWCLTSATAAIFCAQIVANIASFSHPDYVATQWQIYLMYVAFMIAATAVVCWLPRVLPASEIMFFICSVTACVVFFITILATSSPKQSARAVFVDYVNQTGWSDGTAFLLGVGQATYTYLGIDGVIHLAEEIPNPGRNVPRVILLTMAIGTCTAIPMTLAFLFSASDLSQVSASALPIMTIYYQAMRSEAAAVFFMCWFLWIYFGATIACIATTGRLAWAFARDNGLPLSGIWSRIHPTLQVPVNATLITSLAAILYGLIYIASITAFNSFLAMAILTLNVTYVVPQAIVLYRGRSKVLPKRHFNLGHRLGMFFNAFSIAWVALYTVLFCFPLFYPPTLEDMNYAGVVVVGIIVIITVFWFTGKRKTFHGPNVHLELVDGIVKPSSSILSSPHQQQQQQQSTKQTVAAVSSELAI